MVDRRFSLALVCSAGLHMALMGSPGWRLAVEPEVESTPLEARLLQPKLALPPPPAAVVATPRSAARHSRPARSRQVPQAPTGAIVVPKVSASTQPTMAADSPSSAQPESAEPGSAPPVKLDAALPDEVFPAQGRIVFAGMRGAGGFGAANVEQQWHIEGERYRITMALNILFIRWVWRSDGRMTANGFTPESFRKERNGKTTDEVRFDWATRGVVSDGGGRVAETPILEGSQDALSIFYQLALFPPAESGTAIPIANGKTYQARTFEVMGQELLTTRLGALRTAHLRLGQEGEDTIDVWLSLKHKNLPVRILWRQRDGIATDFVAVRLEYGDIKLVAPEPPPPHQG